MARSLSPMVRAFSTSSPYQKKSARPPPREATYKLSARGMGNSCATAAMPRTRSCRMLFAMVTSGADEILLEAAMRVMDLPSEARRKGICVVCATMYFESFGKHADTRGRP